MSATTHALEAAARSRFGRHGQIAELTDAQGRVMTRLDLGLARGFTLRLFGLMGRRRLQRLPCCEALLLLNCRSIHTCFMRAAIDLAFLDAEGRVVAVREQVAPWRVRAEARPAVHTLELPPGAVRALGLNAGWRMAWHAGRPETPEERA